MRADQSFGFLLTLLDLRAAFLHRKHKQSSSVNGTVDRYTHPRTHTHAHTEPPRHTRTHTHTHKPNATHSQRHSHSHTHTLTHSHTETLTHRHTLTLPSSPSL